MPSEEEDWMGSFFLSGLFAKRPDQLFSRKIHNDVFSDGLADTFISIWCSSPFPSVDTECHAFAGRNAEGVQEHFLEKVRTLWI